jgi:hypothetical protein
MWGWAGALCVRCRVLGRTWSSPLQNAAFLRLFWLLGTRAGIGLWRSTVFRSRGRMNAVVEKSLYHVASVYVLHYAR